MEETKYLCSIEFTDKTRVDYTYKPLTLKELSEIISHSNKDIYSVYAKRIWNSNGTK